MRQAVIVQTPAKEGGESKARRVIAGESIIEVDVPDLVKSLLPCRCQHFLARVEEDAEGACLFHRPIELILQGACLLPRRTPEVEDPP